MQIPRPLLASLPSVDRVLSHPDLAEALRVEGRDRVRDAVRVTIGEARARVLALHPPDVPETAQTEVTEEAIVRAVTLLLSTRRARKVRRVINATGVLLHTNLGRAPLSAAAVEALTEAAAGYASIELDVASGRRGKRGPYAEEALARLAGAEASLLVNNCAAAVLLVLASVARGGSVLVSRGELVEIGGGFRVPEVLEESGARLVEVGTTNKTRLADYARALDQHPDIRAILRVHPGNFRMSGFVERPNLAELCALAHQRKIPLIKDLGSGALIRFEGQDNADPTARQSIESGCDAVCFSTDKLLGGPQGGAIVGSSRLVEQIRRAPLARALRIGRLPLVALESTLDAYLVGDLQSIPVIRAATTEPAALEARCQSWVHAIGEHARVLETEATLGGGALGGERIRSFGIALSSDDAEALSSSLREGSIIGRIEAGEVILDARTVLPDEDAALLRGVMRALGLGTPDSTGG